MKLRNQKDPQRVHADGVCTLCGMELYPGQERWRIWGATVCRDCLLQLVGGGRKPEEVRL